MLAVLNMIIHHINKSIDEYSISIGIFIIFITIIMYISEKIGFKKFIFEIKEKFIKDYSYKWKILFYTYFYFILKKSLLNRSKGMKNSLEFAFKRDWLFLVKDTWSRVQAMENILFFIPSSLFFTLAFFNEKKFELKLLKKVGKLSFLLSLFIELTQLTLTIGTFQLSDVVYNTIGGIIGYILAILVNCINNFIEKEYLKGEKMKKVTKAVIPAAGLGTRVLPATKAQPKEMFVIVDKPSLQYIVEELVESGITDIVIVTGRNKNSIEDHFDFSYELENTLQKENKIELLEKVDKISSMANIFYVRQNHPLGLGHAILKAKPFIGDEPFVIALGDDIVYNPERPVAKQLIENYEKYGASIVGCQEVALEDVSKYGVVKPTEKLDENTVAISDFVEKPSKEEAPSRLACLGRSLLDGKIFNYLEETKAGKGGEIQLTDAILKMLQDGERVVAYEFQGKRYDIGNKFGLLKANIEFGLKNDETKEELKNYLKTLKLD